MKNNRHNNHVRSMAILSQLAGMLDCSLARYLSNARPWCRRPYLLLDALTRRLAYDHENHAVAIVQLLHARRHNVSALTFPMEFTYYNDLSLEYLAPRLLDHQWRLIAVTKAALSELDADNEAQRLVAKLSVSLREYAAILEELLAPHRVAPPPFSTDNRPTAKLPGGAPQRSKRSDATSKQPQTAA